MNVFTSSVVDLPLYQSMVLNTWVVCTACSNRLWSSFHVLSVCCIQCNLAEAVGLRRTSQVAQGSDVPSDEREGSVTPGDDRYRKLLGLGDWHP